MTNYYYKTMTKTHKDPTRFSGLIHLSDFETDYRGKDNTDGSTIAQRIITDWKFDEHCRKNKIQTTNYKNYWR